jgi:hypothetical protein
VRKENLKITGTFPKTYGMLTMTELAAYCNRHPTLLRRYYVLDLLPNPKATTYHARRTTRLFTQQEAEQIKRMFDTAEWGTFKKIEKRNRTKAAARKKR